MRRYNTIGELKNAIISHKIDENDLQIILDNDIVSFLVKDGTQEISVKSASGYDDIYELYKLVFPRADVDWC